MPNKNHPAKGSVITVEPIRSLKQIAKIKEQLSDKPRDLALFVLGINTNLRASDLRRLVVDDVDTKKPGDIVELREKKTGKIRRFTLNKSCCDAIQSLLAGRSDLSEGGYLFKSRKGSEALTVSSINGLVKSWCRKAKVKGRIGAHSLRKSWGYHQRKTFGVAIEVLCQAFNHSTPAITMRYLGIEDKEVQACYSNEI